MKLADFGLVRSLDDADAACQSGVSAGAEIELSVTNGEVVNYALSEWGYVFLNTGELDIDQI